MMFPTTRRRLLTVWQSHNYVLNIQWRSHTAIAFVSLVVSRGGHVSSPTTIQRRSCPETRLCIVAGFTWRTHDLPIWHTKTVFLQTRLCMFGGHRCWTRDVPLHCHTKTVFTVTCLCMFSGHTWQTRDVPVHCHTKTVFPETRLCIITCFTWRTRDVALGTLWRLRPSTRQKEAHFYACALARFKHRLRHSPCR